MTRTLRIEAPPELTLKVFLNPEESGLEGDEGGYALTEIVPRTYEVEIEEELIFGIYSVRVVMESEAPDITIDSGYVKFAATAGTYIMTQNKPDACPVAASTEGLTFSTYGPKRVKTKEMEIEQFAPSEIMKADERAIATSPTFCEGGVCVGRYDRRTP